MSEYKATGLFDATEIKNPGSVWPLIRGLVMVEPPFHVGPSFSEAVLGVEPSGVSLSEVVTMNDKATVLLIESDGGSGLQPPGEDFAVVATRIEEFLNATPETMMELVASSPFSPSSRRERI